MFVLTLIAGVAIGSRIGECWFCWRLGTVEMRDRRAQAKAWRH